jgi:hypothetical protein
MESQLAVIGQDNGLEATKVESLVVKFNDSFFRATELVEKSQNITVTSEDQIAEMKEARTRRLELKNLRVEVEKTRKQEKDQSLREGRTIDLMANKIKDLIEPTEAHLEAQEKFAENLAKEHKDRVTAERRGKISAITDADPSIYKLEDMTDAEFESLAAELKTLREQREAAAKAALEETKRKAEEAAAEQERIRQENVKLRAEAEAREAELAKERAEQEKKLAAERAIADEERKKREAIELAKQQADAKEAEEKSAQEEAQRQALLAPDKEKLLKLADTIDGLPLPNVSDREAAKVLDETKDFIARISKNLRQKAEQL